MNIIRLVTFTAMMLSTGLSVAENTENFSTFEGLDKNSDGYISIAEAQDDPDLLKHWMVLDTDADGKIEIVEFSAFESEDAPASFYVPPDDEGSPGAAPY